LVSRAARGDELLARCRLRGRGVEHRQRADRAKLQLARGEAQAGTGRTVAPVRRIQRRAIGLGAVSAFETSAKDWSAVAR
jgi:hypothetical protein